MKIILLDLDGTLTNTAHLSFKPMKDGKVETELNKIPIFKGAVEFVQTLKERGYEAIIASDSHPKYVKKIAEQIFQLEYISLCDKPNISKARDYLFARCLDTVGHPNIDKEGEKDDFLMIGDSWLDIELGRRLNIKTVLTRFYKAKQVEERDGIGQDWKPVKTGPTYYAESFEEILEIIENPLENLLSIEAIFQGMQSTKMVKFLYRNYNGNFTAFRCLARQEDGECDRFARADKYYQIDHLSRSPNFLKILAQGVSNYLKRVAKYPEYEWHYLTYVADKKTTKPPNKMKEIFELVESTFPKKEVFRWVDDVEGKLRQQPDYKARRAFISKNLNIINDVNVKDKNIIIIDDQFTSSATGNEISYQLRNNGAKNILFIALFYLILPIESKTCPKVINGQICGQPLKIKIRKSDGNKFYSCVPPKYRGKGCGYTENIR
jgi:phosphoglycolate phosphatase-like HAD superfamily hydrolase